MWNRGAPGWAVQNRTVFHKNLTGQRQLCRTVLHTWFYLFHFTWISGYPYSCNFGIVGHVLLLVTLGIAPAYGADIFLPRDGGLPPGRSSRRAGLSSQPHQPVNLLMVSRKQLRRVLLQNRNSVPGVVSGGWGSRIQWPMSGATPGRSVRNTAAR